MPKTARDYRELLLAGRWFSGLSTEFQNALLDAGRTRTVAVDEHLFSRGDAPDGLYAVLDGGFRVTGLGSTGKEAVLAIVESPQWFGEIAVFDGLPRTHDGIAAVESTVLHVPSEALIAIFSRRPEWWRDLALLVTAKLRLAFLTMEDTALLPLAPRLARRLVLMAEGYGERGDRSRRVVKVRQEMLAAMVASSRQTTNQALKDFETRGLIKLAYGEIEILDLEALRRQ